MRKSPQISKKNHHKISLTRLEWTNQTSISSKPISKANLFACEENKYSFSSHVNTHKKQSTIQKYSGDNAVH